jgi:hypothetical protein
MVLSPFSQPQALANETAIDATAIEDKRFGDLLEDERDRCDKAQFVGLFVKNLERGIWATSWEVGSVPARSILLRRSFNDGMASEGGLGSSRQSKYG